MGAASRSFDIPSLERLHQLLLVKEFGPELQRVLSDAFPDYSCSCNVEAAKDSSRTSATISLRQGCLRGTDVQLRWDMSSPNRLELSSSVTTKLQTRLIAWLGGVVGTVGGSGLFIAGLSEGAVSFAALFIGFLVGAFVGALLGWALSSVFYLAFASKATRADNRTLQQQALDLSATATQTRMRGFSGAEAGGAAQACGGAGAAAPQQTNSAGAPPDSRPSAPFLLGGYGSFRPPLSWSVYVVGAVSLFFGLSGLADRRQIEGLAFLIGFVLGWPTYGFLRAKAERKIRHRIQGTPGFFLNWLAAVCLVFPLFMKRGDPSLNDGAGALVACLLLYWGAKSRLRGSKASAGAKVVPTRGSAGAGVEPDPATSTRQSPRPALAYARKEQPLPVASPGIPVVSQQPAGPDVPPTDRRAAPAAPATAMPRSSGPRRAGRRALAVFGAAGALVIVVWGGHKLLDWHRHRRILATIEECRSAEQFAQAYELAKKQFRRLPEANPRRAQYGVLTELCLFDLARQEDDPDAYQDYLDQYPSGTYASAARERQDHAAFRLATEHGKAEAFAAYLRGYGEEARHRQRAEELMDAVNFRLAEAAGTPEAYRKCVEQLRTDPVKRKALEALDDAAFGRAKTSRAPATFRAYLKEFPSGRHAGEAAELLDDTCYELAAASSADDGLRRYLKDFPKGRHPGEARDKLDRRAWERARARGDAAAYRAYLRAQPVGAYGADARARIDLLQYREVADADAVAAYRAFLKKHPENRHADDVRKALRVKFEEVKQRYSKEAGVRGTDKAASQAFLALLDHALAGGSGSVPVCLVASTSVREYRDFTPGEKTVTDFVFRAAAEAKKKQSVALPGHYTIDKLPSERGVPLVGDALTAAARSRYEEQFVQSLQHGIADCLGPDFLCLSRSREFSSSDPYLLLRYDIRNQKSPDGTPVLGARTLRSQLGTSFRGYSLIVAVDCEVEVGLGAGRVAHRTQFTAEPSFYVSGSKYTDFLQNTFRNSAKELLAHFGLADSDRPRPATTAKPQTPAKPEPRVSGQWPTLDGKTAVKPTARPDTVNWAQPPRKAPLPAPLARIVNRNRDAAGGHGNAQVTVKWSARGGVGVVMSSVMMAGATAQRRILINGQVVQGWYRSTKSQTKTFTVTPGKVKVVGETKYRAVLGALALPSESTRRTVDVGPGEHKTVTLHTTW